MNTVGNLLRRLGSGPFGRFVRVLIFGAVAGAVAAGGESLGADPAQFSPFVVTVLTAVFAAVDKWVRDETAPPAPTG